MVAEAVKETEVVPAIGDTSEPPEPTSQPNPAEPEAVNDAPASEPDENASIDAVLKDYGLETEDGTDTATGSAAATESKGRSLKDLTPEEAFQKGQEATLGNIQQQAAEAQRQARINGTHNAFFSARDTRVAYMQQQGYPVEDIQAEFNLWNQAYGQVGQVVAAEVDTAKKLATNEMNDKLVDFLYQAGAALVGKEFSSLRQDHEGKANNGGSLTEAILIDLVEHARKGYLTPKEAQAKTNDALRNAFKKFPADVKKALGFTDSSTSTAQNATGVGSPAAERARLADPNTPISEIVAIRTRQKAGR